MRIASATTLASFTTILAACSSGTTSSSPGAPSFVGVWSCTTQEQLTFTNPANSTPESLTDASDVTIVADPDGSITATASGDGGGGGCPLRASVSGETASLVAGQTCSGQGLTVAFTGGTVQLNGSKLTASYTFTFSGSIVAAGDAGTQAVVGTGTESYACTKP
jgi:hypothetical protein